MPFCPNCGTQVSADANFCPNCGSKQTAVTQPVNTVMPDAIYRVILVDKGDCTKALAKEVLRDLIGYTLTNAGALVDAMPVEIARNLTRDQAVYVSQVLTDYGMNTAISDNKNAYVDFSRYAARSIFSDSGAFLTDAAAVLGTLSALNQVTSITRWSQPNPFSFLFRTEKRRTPPPKTTWSSIFGTRNVTPPPPKPAPKPAARPAPKPQHAPVIHGQPSPAPKPPVPNPPVRNPGLGSRAQEPPRKHTAPVTGASRSFGPNNGPRRP
ncbi:MAG: zinc ribbon domain-containing protein [Clostridia bacterium]|nr:zinc ribbon domain-containing protein [Clostridia bacterium]